MNTEEHPNSTTKICLDSFKQHWAQTQLDGPMQTIARYDDVAKLLITIGGFLLAVLAGSYSMMVKDLRPYMNVATARRESAVIFFSMLLFFVATAGVCLFQPKMRASLILGIKTEVELDGQIDDWCKNVARIIHWKKALLITSTTSFIISFLVMMFMLLGLLTIPAK
jgi:hypothetical protein